MPEYTDYTFNYSAYNKAAEYTDANALILAIKNILFSKPGNYPFTPSFGMDIEKYQFDLLDSTQIETIRSELLGQISKFIPSLENVFVDVRQVEDDIGGVSPQQGALGIVVSSDLNSQPLTTSFFVYKDDGRLNIINEIL
jgi:phage baseplate assembly protein W